MNRTSRFTLIPDTRDTTELVRPGSAKRLIAGLATTVLMAGGLGLAGLALAGPAQARPTWCPGDPLPAAAPWPGFNWSSCYEYSGAGGQYGYVDLGTGVFHPAPLDIPATP